jgi:hypothetical protein
MDILLVQESLKCFLQYFDFKQVKFRFGWYYPGVKIRSQQSILGIGVEMTFPTVNGSNLLREKVTLPWDFQGRFNLVFIPFEQWQQMEVDSWMALAKELEEQFDGLVYYELPTIQSRNTLFKMFINEGMRAGSPNPKTRERTITLYLDKIDFRYALGMFDEEHIYILVVDRQGNEFFRARGPYSREGEVSLRQALFQLAKKAEE